MTTKKRSRFATEKTAQVVPEVLILGEYADDYMAPLEQLLDESSKPPVSAPVSSSATASTGKRKLQSFMEETRVESMSVPISSSNIGFKLLQKIGYKEGEGLGKDSKGLVEPIAVLQRANKDVSGLGVAEQKKRKVQQVKSMQQVKQTYLNNLETSYVSQQKAQNNDAHVIRDMKKAQKIIYELDEQAGVGAHGLTASLQFRYDSSTRLHPNMNADAECTTSSIRSANIYDRYSGVDTIDTVLEDELVVDESLTSVARVTNNLDAVCPPDPSLQECLLYLRDRYWYCYYCGAKYDDADDLANNCPGLSEDDH